MRIPLIKPFIDEYTKKKVLEVLDSGHLTEGPVTGEFESVCRDYIDCRHAIAVCSCTVGLEMALRCLNIGPGDEVIVPDYTYPATADVVAIVGAKIVLVDVNPETMLIDYDALESAIGPRTKAVIPVSLFGNPLEYNRLGAIKERHGIYIVEDAAGALGAEYLGKRVGSQADITVFSLHPRKFITTGEGGLITTNNDNWASWLNSYKKFGLRPSNPVPGNAFAMIGSNFKLSDVLGAIGLGQMQCVNELLSRRRELAENYIRLLTGVEGIRIPGTTKGSTHSYQSFCVFVEKRDAIIADLRRVGIEVQIGTYSLHKEKAFSDTSLCDLRGDMDGSDYVYGHCLTLPLYHSMSERDQEEVVNAVIHHLEG